MSYQRPHDAQLVHELRKTIKRMRALARLLRYALDKQQLSEVNDSLRTSGQRLAGERDAQVRLATLERLRERHPKALAIPGAELLEKHLHSERELSSRPANDHELLGDIAGMHGILRRWGELDLEPNAIARGLGRIYKEGRLRYKRVLAGHTASTDLHDWRKRVKSLYYALEMLEGTQGATQAVARAADRLGDVLGEEHDLWMLAVYLEEHPDACGKDATARKRLLKLIKRRRRRLRGRALKLGRQVYELRRSELLSLFEDQ